MISPFCAVLLQTLNHTLQYLEYLEHTPVDATTTLTELRQRLGRLLPDTGMEVTQVIDELVADTSGGILGNVGGRFFGWVIGGSLPAALAADWLTATWDQNAALYAVDAEWRHMLLCGNFRKKQKEKIDVESPTVPFWRGSRECSIA